MAASGFISGVNLIGPLHSAPDAPLAYPGYTRLKPWRTQPVALPPYSHIIPPHHDKRASPQACPCCYRSTVAVQPIWRPTLSRRHAGGHGHWPLPTLASQGWPKARYSVPTSNSAPEAAMAAPSARSSMALRSVPCPTATPAMCSRALASMKPAA